MSQLVLPSTTDNFSVSTPAPHYSPSLLSSDDDDDDIDTLPYPTELPRSDFLQPDFDPQSYLSTLRNRHQTLEDLRSDLRQRSQLLNKELLDLVNGNYEEFLSLGSDLRGGEEKVEGISVGMLGFQREVEGIKTAVNGRTAEVRELVREKKKIRHDVVLGRALLDVNERIGELETSLGITDEVNTEEDEDDEDDEVEEDTGESASPRVPVQRLQRYVQQYLLVMAAYERIGADHPFLVAQRERLEAARKTVLLDLGAALRQARHAKAAESILAVVKIYADLDAEAEGLKVLKAG